MGKDYTARITGTDPTYKYKREFSKSGGIQETQSGGTRTYSREKNGQQKVIKGGTKTLDRYFKMKASGTLEKMKQKKLSKFQEAGKRPLSEKLAKFKNPYKKIAIRGAVFAALRAAGKLKKKNGGIKRRKYGTSEQREYAANILKEYRKQRQAGTSGMTGKNKFRNREKHADHLASIYKRKANLADTAYDANKNALVVSALKKISKASPYHEGRIKAESRAW